MKQIIIILSILFFFSTATKAQNGIVVCEDKACHIISGEKITYIQVGDNNKIVAEVVPDIPNLVRAKAIEPFDGETSLALVSGGKVYSVFVKYSDTQKLTYRLSDFDAEPLDRGNNTPASKETLKSQCEKILAFNRATIRGHRQAKDGIVFRLANIYVKNDLLFCELEITNNGNVGYDIDGFHWWIDDKKQYKATNTQEYEVKPEFRYCQNKKVGANERIKEVFVLPKLTVPDKRILKIELLEKALGNTGRKLCLKVKGSDIVRAKSF